MYHTIKATSNHPFLVLKRNGRGKQNNFVWKTLSEIQKGDEVVVVKKWKEKKPNHSCSKYQINEHFETEKVTHIKSVGIEPTLDLRVEDEHNFIADGIVVHNTGVQRSSATPFGADTTTDPAGTSRHGKQEFKKDITEIIAAHGIPYVAQAAIGNWPDLLMKAEKALEMKGPAFINVLSPCIPGWRIRDDQAIEISKLAVETCFWPLFEVENNVWKLTYNPAEKKKPVIEWLKVQGRFKHLFKPGNEETLKKIQEEVDMKWELLKRKCEVK